MTIKNSIQLSVNLKVASTPTVKYLHGVKYTVIPLVGLVEGVITPGNDGTPQLALASEFAKFPDSWNNRPVVFNHPVGDVKGTSVSANHPEILESWSIGTIFNARVEELRLLMEAWIDPERVKTLSEKHDNLEATLQAIDDGQMVEVSTGLFADLEDSEGLYAGEKFVGIWRNVVPDHLAILELGSIGACSQEDGCGIPRINQAAQNIVRTLEPHEFCDKCHALRFVMSDGSSHYDQEAAIISAMQVLKLEEFFYVIAVYDDFFVYANFDGMFQREYSISDEGEITIGESKVRVRSKTQFVPVSASVQSEDGGESVQTVPANMQLSTDGLEERMKDQVKELIDSDLTRFTESDSEWLEQLPDEQLDRLQPTDDVVTLKTENTQLKEHIQSQEDQTSQEEEPITAAEYVAAAPPEVQTVLKEGLKMQENRRRGCVEIILGQSTNQFTQEELDGFELETLEKLAALSRRPNYEGVHGGNIDQADDRQDDHYAPEPPRLLVSK